MTNVSIVGQAAADVMSRYARPVAPREDQAGPGQLDFGAEFAAA